MVIFSSNTNILEIAFLWSSVMYFEINTVVRNKEFSHMDRCYMSRYSFGDRGNSESDFQRWKTSKEKKKNQYR